MMVNLKNFELISFIDHVRILFIEKNIIERLLRNSYFFLRRSCTLVRDRLVWLFQQMGFIDSSILMVCAEERDDITRVDSDKSDSIFHRVQTSHDSGIFFFFFCSSPLLFMFSKCQCVSLILWCSFFFFLIIIIIIIIKCNGNKSCQLKRELDSIPLVQ